MTVDGCAFTSSNRPYPAGASCGGGSCPGGVLGGGSAIDLGGASTNVFITRSSFVDNFALGAGGGAISATISGLLWIEESEFLRNRADSGNGGAIKMYGLDPSRLHLESTTFSGNSALDTLDDGYSGHSPDATHGGDALFVESNAGTVQEMWSDAEVMASQPLDSFGSGAGGTSPPPPPPHTGGGH